MSTAKTETKMVGGGGGGGAARPAWWNDAWGPVWSGHEEKVPAWWTDEKKRAAWPGWEQWRDGEHRRHKSLVARAWERAEAFPPPLNGGAWSVSVGSPGIGVAYDSDFGWARAYPAGSPPPFWRSSWGYWGGPRWWRSNYRRYWARPAFRRWYARWRRGGGEREENKSGGIGVSFGSPGVVVGAPGVSVGVPTSTSVMYDDEFGWVNAYPAGSPPPFWRASWGYWGGPEWWRSNYHRYWADPRFRTHYYSFRVGGDDDDGGNDKKSGGLFSLGWQDPNTGIGVGVGLPLTPSAVVYDDEFGPWLDAYPAGVPPPWWDPTWGYWYGPAWWRTHWTSFWGRPGFRNRYWGWRGRHHPRMFSRSSGPSRFSRPGMSRSPSPSGFRGGPSRFGSRPGMFRSSSSSSFRGSSPSRGIGSRGMGRGRGGRRGGAQKKEEIVPALCGQCFMRHPGSHAPDVDTKGRRRRAGAAPAKKSGGNVGLYCCGRHAVIRGCTDARRVLNERITDSAALDKAATIFAANPKFAKCVADSIGQTNPGLLMSVGGLRQVIVTMPLRKKGGRDSGRLCKNCAGHRPV